MPENKNSLINSILLWGSLGVAIGGILFILLLPIVAPGSTVAYGLPLLMIFGVIALLDALTISGMIFSETNLSCKDEALGLPAGSIRALIALSLIIIFAIMAVYMYSQLTPETSFLQIPANQTILYPNGTIIQNPNGSYLITQQTSQAQKDFSTQTLTTVSTLVVALAGFYFGTKAVATAQGREEKEPEYGLTITPEGEMEYQEDKTLYIEVETEPKGEKFKFTVDGDKPESVRIGRVSNEFTYTPSPSPKRNKNAVTINFALESKPKISKKLTVVVEKLEATTEHEGKLKVGDSMTIEVKATPENAKLTPQVNGDEPNSLKESKGKFTYTPTAKAKGQTITLTFELDVKPKITQQLEVEVE